MKTASFRYFFYLLHLLIPAVIAVEIFLSTLSSQFRETTLEHLNALASIQKSRLEEMISFEYQRVESITSRTTLRNYLTDFLKNGNLDHTNGIKRILDDAMRPFTDVSEIFVLDPQGQLIVSTNAREDQSSPVSARIFSEAKKRTMVVPYEVKTAQAGGEGGEKTLQLLLTGPFFLEGQLIGVAGLLTDDSVVTRIANDYSGLGETGETVIARLNKQGDAEFISHHRDFQHPEAGVNIPMHRINAPIIQALMRYEGLLTRATDYRGKAVFAAVRYLQEEDWGVVVKIDRDEVLRPVRQLRFLGYACLAGVMLVWSLCGKLWLKIY